MFCESTWHYSVSLRAMLRFKHSDTKNVTGTKALLYTTHYHKADVRIIRSFELLSNSLFDPLKLALATLRKQHRVSMSLL